MFCICSVSAEGLTEVQTCICSLEKCSAEQDINSRLLPYVSLLGLKVSLDLGQLFFFYQLQTYGLLFPHKPRARLSFHMVGDISESRP